MYKLLSLAALFFVISFASVSYGQGMGHNRGGHHGDSKKHQCEFRGGGGGGHHGMQQQHGPGMMGGGHHGMAGKNHMGMMGMRGGCFMHGSEDTAQHRKIMQETKELRKKMHDLKFNYHEAMWNEKTTLGELEQMKAEMSKLREDIAAKFKAAE